MKTLLKIILLLSFITTATQASTIVCKYDGNKDELDMSEMKIVLGDKEDKFSTDTGDEFVASPIEGNRFKWVVLEIGKYKLTFDAIKGEFEYLRNGKVESIAKIKCEGVDKAIVLENYRKLTSPPLFLRGKLEINDDSRFSDLSKKSEDLKAPRDSDSTVNGSSNK